MLDNLAESMAYLTEAHTSLIVAKEEAAGRLEDSFAAAFELVQELQNEITQVFLRVSQGKEH